MVSPKRIAGGTLFVIAYVMLFVGLFGDLVQYQYETKMDPSWFKGHKDEKMLSEIAEALGDMQVPVITPTTRSLISTHGEGAEKELGLLPWLLEEAKQGKCSYFAPVALLFFGICLPAVKLIAMIYWSLVPSASHEYLHFAARLSRWAAVDATTEALMVAILLQANVHAKHELGFAAFVLYVILSAASMWLIDDFERPRQIGWPPRLVVRCLGNQSVPKMLVPTTLVIFLALMTAGSSLVLGELRVTPESVKRSSGLHSQVQQFEFLLSMYGDNAVQRVIDGVAERVPLPQAQTSLFGAVVSLLGSGHFYTIFGSLLLFICLLVCPVLGACGAAFLARSAAAAASGGSASAAGAQEEKPLLGGKPSSRSSMQFLVECCADLAMLDVFVIGVLVTFMAIGSIELLTAELLTGYFILLLAAAAQYVHEALCGALLLQARDSEAEAEALEGDAEVSGSSALS